MYIDIFVRSLISVCMLMTTVLKVSAKGFWHDFVCMHYTILRLRDDRTIRVGCNT